MCPPSCRALCKCAGGDGCDKRDPSFQGRRRQKGYVGTPGDVWKGVAVATRAPCTLMCSTQIAAKGTSGPVQHQAAKISLASVTQCLSSSHQPSRFFIPVPSSSEEKIIPPCLQRHLPSVLCFFFSSPAYFPYDIILVLPNLNRLPEQVSHRQSFPAES